MSIYKHKGKWRAEVWNEDRRLASKAGFETKELAKAWFNRISIDFKLNAETLRPAKKHTFKDLLENYQKIHMPTISAETRRRYLTDIDFRIREYFQYLQLDSITPLMIETFRGKIMEA